MPSRLLRRSRNDQVDGLAERGRSSTAHGQSHWEWEFVPTMVCMSSRSASTSATDSREGMRGSIEKYSTTAGARWRVRNELPPGPDGSRRQRTERGFLRQRDAERALREAIGSVQDGTYVEPSQDTVAQWLEEWLERRRPIDTSAARRHRGELAPSTWAQYRTYIDSMIVPVIGDSRLRDLQPGISNASTTRWSAPAVVTARATRPRPSSTPTASSAARSSPR
jgi:hypothetical protein